MYIYTYKIHFHQPFLTSNNLTEINILKYLEIETITGVLWFLE